MDAEEVANKLYGIANEYDWNGEDFKLEKEGVDSIIDILTIVGFEPSGLESGTIPVWEVDQDGSRIRPYSKLNSTFPFIVMNEEGEEDSYVTGWINQTIERARRIFEERHKTIDALTNIINRSVPLEPILLTSDGDYLVDNTPNTNTIGGHDFHRARVRDEDKVGGGPDIHKYCRGFVGRIRATKEKDALVCRKCGIRVLFPRTVKTYKDLRRVMKSAAS